MRLIRHELNQRWNQNVFHQHKKHRHKKLYNF